jgi:hypothetical protein
MSSYIFTMARQPHAGHGGRSGSGRGGHGGGFPKQNKPETLPHRSGEGGDCKDLKGNVFTIGSGNKGKDGDMLCTSKEKLALYFGTNYGYDYLEAVARRGNWRESPFRAKFHEMKTEAE